MSGHRSCSMETQSASNSFLQSANQYQDNQDSSPNNSPGPQDDGKSEEIPLKYSSSSSSPDQIHDHKKFNDAQALKLENGVAAMKSFEVGGKGEKEGDDCKESTKKRERVENIVTSIMARDNGASSANNNLFPSYEAVSCAKCKVLKLYIFLLLMSFRYKTFGSIT